MANPRRIGLLGGSFNPAHAGHVHISEEALKRLDLDEIWWLVSPKNPLKKASDLAEYEVRFAYAKQLARHPRIKVLDLEKRHHLHYTIDTILYLKKRYWRSQFVWLMGADNLAGFHRWRRWKQIAALLPIAVMDRAPYALRSLSAPFTRIFSATRLSASAAGVLATKPAPAWLYLSVPRHPLSSTYLRKTLGKNAFLRHSRFSSSKE